MLLIFDVMEKILTILDLAASFVKNFASALVSQIVLFHL